MDAIVSYFGKRDFSKSSLTLLCFFGSRESKAQEMYSSHGAIIGDTFVNGLYFLVHSMS